MEASRTIWLAIQICLCRLYKQSILEEMNYDNDLILTLHGKIVRLASFATDLYRLHLYVEYWSRRIQFRQ